MNNYDEEILKKVDEKPKKGIKCTKHPKRQAAIYCDRCNKPFCNACYKEQWRPNFINNVFNASKEKFVKENLCASCSEKANKGQVLFSCALLFLVMSIIFAFIFGLI